MDEAAARPQNAHRLVGGVRQVVAAMKRAIGDHEVVFVAEQGQILEREIRKIEHQKLGPDQSQHARQPDRTRGDDGRLALGILGGKPALQRTLECGPDESELGPQFEREALPQIGPQSLCPNQRASPNRRSISGSYRIPGWLASGPLFCGTVI